MPIYEYRCEFCAHQEEVLQKSTDPAPDHCSACDKKMGLKKVISHSSFQLKGGGWYSDLYASQKPSCDKTACSKPACQKTPVN